KCLDHHGPLTARQALQYSCNDAIAQMSQKINSEFFLQQIHNFGFGSKTGIELPSEEKGLVKDTTDSSWSGRSKPTIAMGQEISVTALQMVQAASAIANGGKPVQLSVVSKILNKDDKVIYQHVPEFKKQVIKKSTADYVLSCMETTARIGTGAKANVGDIAIGVKTGTAQMADTENGGYSDKDFLSSCMAIFPIENPEIILYIVITKAKGETYGGRIVAPVIQDAANTIIDYLGMQRDRAISVTHSGKITIPQTKPIVIKSYVPDFTGYPKRMLTPLLNRTDIKFVIKGDGWVVSQNPEPGTPVTENMIIELTLE
ncbi:MAG: PASTA domain-containing protein, partial [Spirochaetaceae bacterium]|nr:PASTA domain-containing protein [Spirochaetaceae bacterium]